MGFIQIYIDLKVTDANGCSNTSTKEMYVKSQPTDVTRDG